MNVIITSASSRSSFRCQGKSCILRFHDFPDESSYQQIATEEWAFTEILDQLHWNQRGIILDFSHINTSKSWFFHVFIIAPTKKLHHAMDESHSAAVLLFSRSRSDYRAQILVIFYNFPAASAPQKSRFGQSIPFVFLKGLRSWHLHFSLSIGNIFYWISQVCIYFALFLLASSQWELLEFSVINKYKSGFFLPHCCLQLMNFQHTMDICINP